jgi:hypothetical protein
VTTRAVAAATWLVVLVNAPSRAGQPGATSPPARASTPASASTAIAAETARGRRSAADRPRPPGPELVEMTVIGEVADYQRLIAPIGARTPAGVPLLWNRIERFNPLAELLRAEPAATPVALRCWIDLSDLRRATLYFASRGGERFLVRELALSGRLDEVDQQSLAQVLEISITALLENQDSGLSRDEARAILVRAQPSALPDPPPADAASLSRRHWSLGVAASYVVQAIAPSLPFGQGPGLTLLLSTTPSKMPTSTSTSTSTSRSTVPRAIATSQVGVWLAGHYQVPETAAGPEVGVRLQALTARAGLTAGWPLLSLRLGGGADWIRVTPLPGRNGTAVALAAPHWSTNWVLAGALAARAPLDHVSATLARVTLTLVLSVETLVAPTEYEVRDAGGSRVAFSVRRARPGLALELGF